MTMIKKCLAIATALLALLLYPNANARELRPTTEIPIGGHGGAINHTTNTLYASSGIHIRAYDLTNHVVLPSIDTEGSGITNLSINEVSNTIFFSDEEGTWMIDGEAHELEYSSVAGYSWSFILTQVNRRANVMYALYLSQSNHPSIPDALYLEAYEADTLALITYRYWDTYNRTGASFAIDEANHQVFMHLQGGTKIIVLDGATLGTVGSFADGIVSGPNLPQYLPFDPNARRLYAYADGEDGVSVIDVDGQAIIGNIDVTSIRDVVVDRYRRRAYFTSFGDPQLYRIGFHGNLAGSTTVSKIGSITGVPAVNWRTGSVYVPCWDEGYQGLAVIRRGQVIQRVHLDTLINTMFTSRRWRRVHALGQPNTSWELLLRWFGHSSIGDMESNAAVDEMARD
jgi:DNA-binding beta-propeller fold protein YncE